MINYSTNSFNDIKERLEGEEPSFSSAICDCYQSNGHWFPRCDYDWGVVFIYHFKSGEAFQRCSAKLKLWEHIVEHYPELNLQLIPIYEVGENYVVEAKLPPGGYSSSMYDEHLSSGGFVPHESYKVLIGAIRKTAKTIMDQASPEICDLLRTNIIDPSSSLLWDEESESWILFRLDLSLIYEG